MSSTTLGSSPGSWKDTCRKAQDKLSDLEWDKYESVSRQRRQIAELLKSKKEDSARIRVEECIRDDMEIEGVQILSQYLERLACRIDLLDDGYVSTSEREEVCPPELKEAVSSVLWASFDLGDTVPELGTIRNNFRSKFGNRFVDAAKRNLEYSVNEKMMDRLARYPPHNDKCVDYLTGIAQEFSVATFDERRHRDINDTSDTNEPIEEGLPRGTRPELAKKVPGSVPTLSGLYVPPMGSPTGHFEEGVCRAGRFTLPLPTV